MTQLRFIHARGITADEMHKNMVASPLFKIGDCRLVWVSEGDFWALSPTDLAAEDEERLVYERLKAKFE